MQAHLQVKVFCRRFNLTGGLIVFGLILLHSYLLNACTPTIDIPATLTDTPALTLTPTPTTIWFPPTFTPTPFPTIIPTTTPDLKPGIGEVITQDDFTESEHWLTGNMGVGTIALGIEEISLAVTQPKGYLFSFRDELIYDDFYVEITASPSLCSGMDEYGLLIRYNSPVDFYRFSLSCDGQTRLDKLVGGTASSPQPWLASASIPSAAPSISKLGVWAVGREMRFFINDEYHFSISDPVLSRGMIGVFTRSGGENALTVSFSNLIIYQIIQ
jgi:hypothetical protein